MKLGSRLFIGSVSLLVCAAPLFAGSKMSSAHGQIQFDTGTATATLRFHVRQDAATGETVGHIDYSDGGVSFSADVSCMLFANNQASMSGIVTSSSAPELLGTQALLTVEDNGQGNNGPPDRYTWVMTSVADCHSFPPPAQIVTDGQVHVRLSTVPF